MNQRDRGRGDAGNATGLADGDGTDALQRLKHLAGQAADGVVLSQLGMVTDSAALRRSMDLFCCSR